MSTTLQQHYKNISTRAARLALDEAINNLRRSVHPCGCDEGHKGDDVDGEALAKRIGEHVEKIKDALDYYTAARAFFNSPYVE